MIEAVQSHVRAFNAVKCEEALAAELEAATKTLGCSRFALGHHVDLQRMPPDAISITNYDPEWVTEAVSRELYRQDPILVASTRTAVGFRWSDLERMMTLTEHQREILKRGREFALHDGFTIPVHIPGEYLGTCSFGAEEPLHDDEDLFPAAQLIGVFAFEAARRLKQAMLRRNRKSMPSLTGREVDCVTLIACGKSDWEAAKILGIKPDTVAQHIESARRKYGCTKRTQLVVQALFDGQIPFSSVVIA